MPSSADRRANTGGAAMQRTSELPSGPAGSHILVVVLAMAFVLPLAVAGRSHAMDVTSCGQFVRDRDTGVLVGDLDCSSATGSFAVELGTRATLQLAGHTIIGQGVHCPTGCTILGPGDITGAYSAVVGNGSRPMTLAGGLSIHDNLFGV